MRNLVYLFSLLLPWTLRRLLLNRFFGYEIHPTARIGKSWVMPGKLVMEAHTRIGTLTMCKSLDLIHMRPHSTLGNGNWVTGMPRSEARHFAHETDRAPELRLGEHAAITHRHIIDCTNAVTIGRFSTISGYGSQFLTHSIDLMANRQSSKPIVIGEYCFVGTNTVILGGSVLPNQCILGAKSLLNKAFTDPLTLYGGVAAAPLKTLKPEGYFVREQGFIV